MCVFFFNDPATTDIYTTDTLFPYTTLFRSLEQRAYVLTRQVCAAFAFLHQQRQLLEGQFGRIRVDRRNRAGMTAIDVAQVEKCGPIAQRSEEHTSEDQSLMRRANAGVWWKKKEARKNRSESETNTQDTSRRAT